MAMDEFMKIDEELDSMKMRIFAEVEEVIESAKTSFRTKFKSHLKDGNESSSRSKMRLELRNGIARTILTGENIKGEGDVPIEVALVDDVTGDVVADEPEASATVEFLLLKGNSKGDDDDCTAQEFESNIVPQLEGKKQPILDGNVRVQLKGGVAVANIKIRHYASKIKPPEFKLGARVVGGCRVKEAMTEAFTLKDFRVKYYKKHKNPSLSDKVSRLVFIRKGGKIEERLQENSIYTVEDFLIQLLKNPQGLKSIVKSQPKKWKAIVNNAQAYKVSKKVYCYIDPKHNTGVVFNVLGRVLELYSGSYYSQPSTLSEKQKADAETLLTSAYQNWEEVKAFADQVSAEQHMRSNASFHGPSSATNLSGESGGQDFGSEASGSYDIDVTYDAVMKNYSPSLFGDLMSERNGGEAQTVKRSNSPNRWKTLLCVSRWFSVRRRVVALDVIGPNPKRQKVGLR